MLKIPRADDARAAAEKRAQEIIDGDLARGRVAIETAIAEAIAEGKTTANDVRVPRSVYDVLCTELRTAGYSARSYMCDDPDAGGWELDINWSRA